jgi:hypothetical protein
VWKPEIYLGKAEIHLGKPEIQVGKLEVKAWKLEKRRDGQDFVVNVAREGGRVLISCAAASGRVRAVNPI